jgi:hypothetical protein
MPSQPPNIVFIMADDHAAKAISCYGAGINKTPNLDRIANEDMRFDHCYVTNSICTPSCCHYLRHSQSRQWSPDAGLEDQQEAP